MHRPVPDWVQLPGKHARIAASKKAAAVSGKPARFPRTEVLFLHLACMRTHDEPETFTVWGSSADEPLNLELNMQATHIQYDAIVSGAGPVGLFLSCELALAGCSVLILEREADPHSPFKQLPFGIRGLSAPTIDALYRRGLLDQLEVPKRLKNPFGAGEQA